MKYKCQKCGHDEFYAKQPTRGTIAVVVDENGKFKRNLHRGTRDAKWIPKRELTYGEPEKPFLCLKCGAEWRDPTSVRIEVKLWNDMGINCLEKDCKFNKECANHASAGDYRSEGGFTPELTIEGKEPIFYCATKNKEADEYNQPEGDNDRGYLYFNRDKFIIEKDEDSFF